MSTSSSPTRRSTRGNSGGPTFSEKGEVVGVNTAVFLLLGGSIGIGFAIPAATASAGLRPGDVITAVQGREVGDAADVIRSVTRADVGQVLRLSILRNGRSMSINVPVQRRAP